MIDQKKEKPVLLSILELGGYPDFSKLYQALGFQVNMIDSMRKALKFIKNNQLQVIVVEFNFQSDFRDRSSQLESLMASIAQSPEVKVIVFYDKEQSMQFSKVNERYNFYSTLTYPIEAEGLKSILEQI